ncbi:hypothetical protein H8356DRAFT_1320092 [Neocallimastix lanati (nom. inval.)]|nr:hypothetical protein H8356DRAFT_1320092 [Neocallimastix sp. JGI-2020a]
MDKKNKSNKAPENTRKTTRSGSLKSSVGSVTAESSPTPVEAPPSRRQNTGDKKMTSTPEKPAASKSQPAAAPEKSQPEASKPEASRPGTNQGEISSKNVNAGAMDFAALLNDPQPQRLMDRLLKEFKSERTLEEVKTAMLKLRHDWGKAYEYLSEFNRLSRILQLTDETKRLLLVQQVRPSVREAFYDLPAEKQTLEDYVTCLRRCDTFPADYKDDYLERYEYNRERKIAIMALLGMMDPRREDPPRILKPKEGGTAIIAEAIKEISVGKSLLSKTITIETRKMTSMINSLRYIK